MKLLNQHAHYIAGHEQGVALGVYTIVRDATASQYSPAEQKLFSTYHQRFKLGSKPAAHIEALAQLTDAELLANMPASLSRLADAVITKLEELPE